MKVLVIQQKMIGDVLASTVICESIKHHFPEALVHFVANENTLPVLLNNPFIDEVFVFKKHYRDSKFAFYTFLRSFKTTEYYAVIDAYGKLESNLISYFAKSTIKIANHKWYSNWVYTHTVRQTRVPNGKSPLSVSNRLLLLDPLVPDTSFVTYPKLYLTQEETEKGRKTVNKLKDHPDQKMIMISVLGSAAHKTYPGNYMAEVLQQVCQGHDVKLLFNYLPEQKTKAHEIYELCDNATQKKIAIDFYATSLRDFIVVVSQCHFLLGNEGGAVNMAKALNTPTFCIFSPFILKGAWHTDADTLHSSVHLRDYRPELFGNMKKTQLKEESLKLYEAFSPELFKDVLSKFIDQNLTS
ncbi:MAG: glycosyltransferase family 9 protein [Flavobacteriaceae bacterium]